MRSLRHERLISEVLKTLGMVTSLNLAILVNLEDLSAQYSKILIGVGFACVCVYSKDGNGHRMPACPRAWNPMGKDTGTTSCPRARARAPS